MKKLTFNLLSILLVLVSFTQVQAQTLDEIIAKNTAAMGGKDKIQSITSIKMENTIEVMGNESESSTIILNGKGAKTISDFNGQKMVQCYTDKGGWMINPMAGSADAAVMPEDQYKSGKSQINIGATFLDYTTKGNKVELLGKEKLQNTDVYKVKVTTPNNLTVFYYFDATTFYVIQTSTNSEMMGQQMEVITKLSDFQKTEFGYVLPKTTTVSYGDQFSLVIKLKKAEFNLPVDTSIFDLGNLK